MAVTAHWLARDSRGRLEIRNRLIAFEHVSGGHDGESLAKYMMNVLEEYEIVHKVCYKMLGGADDANVNSEWASSAASPSTMPPTTVP